MTDTMPTCYTHPSTETNLRCNRCEQYICAKCAVHTPTGYRCKSCNKNLGKVHNTALLQDYILVFMASLVLAYLGSFVVRFVSFFIFFIAPAIGVGIAEVARRLSGRRRSKALFQVMLAAIVIGGSAQIWSLILGIFYGAGFNALIAMLWPAIYIALAASSAYARISGIQIR